MCNILELIFYNEGFLAEMIAFIRAIAIAQERVCALLKKKSKHNNDLDTEFCFH